MSLEHWITFAAIVGLCLIPLGTVAVLEWRQARARDARIRQINAALKHDWEREAWHLRLAALQGPARKGVQARRTDRVVGVITPPRAHGRRQL